jgi:hypothetical protein
MKCKRGNKKRYSPDGVYLIVSTFLIQGETPVIISAFEVGEGSRRVRDIVSALPALCGRMDNFFKEPGG